MGKLTSAGLLSLVCGLLASGFQAISLALNKNGWARINLEMLVGPEYFDRLYEVSWSGLEEIAIYIISMLLYLLLMGPGVLFLAGGFFTAR